MRTLKKTLSLLLAVALVLSLTVVGASAYDNKVDDFDDVEDIGEEYIEAVGVMTGLGIIEGYDDGTFKPATSYTREQAAKIIAYMQLGPAAAEKLACTSAPFTDVAADRWSAGYIAYAKDVGILDGMGDGSFDPAGTLTGFQWAKMLLCAIGYGENGEFTGSEWSINTAKVAQTVKLFEGDPDGMTHAAINREQAVLYAFNTLVDLGVVVYSTALGDYIYSYNDAIFDRVTYEGTLGWNVYKLESAEGIIVDNEGMGASATYLATNYNYTTGTNGTAVAKINADTDIDMMFHGARIWYVGDDAVYVNDLATVTAYNCYEADAEGDAAASKANAQNLSIGSGTEYEFYLIDNSAVAVPSATNNFAYVTVNASLGALGYKNTVAETTRVAGATVPNAKILTDISEIEDGDDIVFIRTTSRVESGSDKYAYHVYPVSYTSGVVQRVTRSSVVLADGTELPISKLGVNFSVDGEVIIGRNYTFMLDNHGDIISIAYEGARDLYAFTGEWRYTTAHDVYGWTTVCQFINVSTGEVIERTISNDDRTPAAGLIAGDYYDLTATANASGVYSAKHVVETDTVYPGAYAVEDDDFVFTRTSDRMSINGQTVYFDRDNVQFLIVTATGDNPQVVPYTGITEFLSNLGTSANSSVRLSNFAVTLGRTSTGGLQADVIFAFTADVATQSNYVFVPYTVDASDWTSIDGSIDGYIVHYEDVAYLDGQPFDTFQVYSRALTGTVLERGFYTVTTVNGIPTLDDKLENSLGELCYYSTTVTVDDIAGTRYELDGRFTVADDVVITDLRAASTEFPAITGNDMQALYRQKQADVDPDMTIGYTVNPATGEVDFIYVVDSGWQRQAIYSLSDELYAAGWRWQDTGASDLAVVDGQYLTVYGGSSDMVNWTIYNTNETLGLVAGGIYSGDHGLTVTWSDNAGASGSKNVDATVVDGNTLQIGDVTEIPELADDNRTVVVEISGLAMDVEFVEGAALDPSTGVDIVPADGEITLGESVEVTAFNYGSLSTSLKTYVTFSGPYDGYDISFEDLSTDGRSVSAEVYPLVWGTYTLSHFDHTA